MVEVAEDKPHEEVRALTSPSWLSCKEKTTSLSAGGMLKLGYVTRWYNIF